ncbi:MAG: class I SAM-dependent methyltransferase [Actinomycetota bacterium]
MDITEERDAFAERLFGSMLGAVDVFTLYLGERLGLYAPLRDGGPMTPGQLASAAGTDERYTREWLEQQAVSEILAVDDPSAAAGVRRYSLPAGHAEVLLDKDSLAFLSPIARIFMSTAAVMPQLLRAFRDGGGVDWGEYGADATEGQADQNRPVFLGMLGSEWLPQIEDVHARLQAEPAARVLDVGCGAGWAAVGIARSYPAVAVDGIDLDAAAIEMGRESIGSLGLGDRIHLHAGDAAEAGLDPGYDLITMFEMVHDLSFPVEVLSTARKLLAEDGSVLVMDEKVAPEFTAPGDDLERLFYGFSVLCCLPTAMVAEGAAGTGTMMRPDVLRGYAEAADFSRFEILPIDHDFFRFYRLRP